MRFRCLVDIQNNGVWDSENHRPIDFSGSDLSFDDVIAFYRQSFRRGIFPCPTLITQPFEQMLKNLRTISSVNFELGIPVPNIHLEGPFFDGDDGAIGAHPKEHVQLGRWDLLDELLAAAQGCVRFLTVGANVVEIYDVIRHAVRQGVIVSLGHHVPTREEIDSAIAAGATMLTHLGNGCPAEVPRRGFLEYQLVHSGLSAGIIPDGSHLEDYFERLVLMLKGASRVIAVSDRSALGGAPVGNSDDGWYELWGSQVQVVPNGHTCKLVGRNGKLAGSWEDQLGCLNSLYQRSQSWGTDGIPGPPPSMDDLESMFLMRPAMELGIETEARMNEIADKLGIARIVFDGEEFVVES